MKNILFKSSICLVFALAHTASLHASENAESMPSEEDMQKMMALMMPGEHHKILDELVGSWGYSMAHRMTPDSPLEVTSGTSENAWILNGRQLKQKVNGTFEMNGQTQTFEGIGLIGYDNMKDEYTSIWIDNVGTGTMVATGTYNPETKTITENGSHMCPIRGHEVKFRSEIQLVDNNRFTYTMYDLSYSDEPFKSMEIEYTRK